MEYESGDDKSVYTRPFEGIIPNLQRRFNETSSESTKAEIQQYMYECPCPACHGKRYRPETLAVRLNGVNIAELSDMSIYKARDFLNCLELNAKQRAVADRVLKELNARLNFLVDVGLGYLTLSLAAVTLSGGEAQRIRLATQIGSGLVGVLYILDEPSIGLHQRDNAKLLRTLKNLRDLGNTLIVVEHDEDTMRESDFIVDIGPGAGAHGGEVVAAGPARGGREKHALHHRRLLVRAQAHCRPLAPPSLRKRLYRSQGRRRKQFETHRRRLSPRRHHRRDRCLGEREILARQPDPL